MFTKPPVFGRRKPRHVVRIGLLVAVVCAPATSALGQTANTIPVIAGQGAGQGPGQGTGPVQAVDATSPTPTARPVTSGKVVVAAAASGQVPDTATPRPEAKAEGKAEVKVPRFSDPLADLAAETLLAMQARGSGPVSVVAPAATPDTAVVTVSNQAQVVGGTAPVATPTQPGSTSWTSAVISTDSLSDYLSGSAIEVPVAPATKNILSKLPTDPQVRYTSVLRQVSIAVASRIKGAKASDLEATWLRTDDRRMTVILTALAQVGTMYRYTGNQPGGFDCSGLTSYSWARAGVKLPRVSGDQISAATPRTPADLGVGDLIWHPGHIGLYLGVNDYMVHSPQTGKAVEVRPWGKAARFGTPL